MIGYLLWLGKHNPTSYAGLLGRVLPLQVNLKTAVKPARVEYRSVEEIKAALRAKGIDPDVIQRAMMVQ
jgi:hypothetical protein